MSEEMRSAAALAGLVRELADTLERESHLPRWTPHRELLARARGALGEWQRAICQSCAADCCRGTLMWKLEKRTGLKPLWQQNEEEVRATLAEAEEEWKPVGTFAVCEHLTAACDCAIYQERPAICRLWHCGGVRWRAKEAAGG